MTWQPVAEGHTLPRISPPMRPLCYHCKHVPGVGWSADCDLPATLVCTTGEGKDIYACGPKHAQQIENEEGMQ